MLFLTLGADMARPSRTGGKTSEAKARNASPAKGRKTTKAKRRIAPAATRVKRRPVSGPSKDLKEAREQQAATAEILKVIASSPSDVQPVFEAIASSANRLIGGFSTAVYRVIDDIIHLVAFTPTNPESDEALKAAFPRHRSEVPPVALVENGETAQIADAETADAQTRQLGRARGWRSVTFTPLMSQGTLIGYIACTRRETGVLADHHVQLLRTFADQAVIAIENVRLFNETQAKRWSSRPQRPKYSRVISSSMADPKPVFEHIVDSVERLFRCKQIAIFLTPGDGLLHLAAGRGVNMEFVSTVYPQPVEQTAAPSVLGARQQVYYEDCLNGAKVPSSLRRAAQVVGNFSDLLTPMMWEGRGVGMMSITREPNSVFSNKERALLRTFADQAVIAIENARLFDEVKARTEDLSESLQQQTATADVLKIINRSSVDLETVLDTLVETVARLCRADQAVMFRRRDDKYHLVAACGLTEEAKDFVLTHPFAVDRGTISGRVVLEHRAVHVADVLQDPEYTYREAQKIAGVPHDARHSATTRADFDRRIFD